MSSRSSTLLEYKIARAILGSDFLTPKEVSARLELIYPDELLDRFEGTLPPQEVLEWCRENGFLVLPGPNTILSLLDIQRLFPQVFHSTSSSRGRWYEEPNQAFSRKDFVRPEWYAIRKYAMVDSINKPWSVWSQLAEEGEYVPNVAELVWMVLVYKLVRGRMLFPAVFARTSSLSAEDFRVNLGSCGDEEIRIRCYRDDLRDSTLGIASALKW